jgi:hypothetical protein
MSGWMAHLLLCIRYMEVLKPIPSEGGSFHLKSSLIGVHPKGKGALVETLSELVDSRGEVYVKFINGVFVVGAKDFVPAGVTHSQNIPVSLFLFAFVLSPSFPFSLFSFMLQVPSRAPDAVEEMATLRHQAHLYRLSGM